MGNTERVKVSQFAFVFTIFIFFINPLLAIVFNILYVIHNNNTNSRKLNLLIILISLYLGLINITKVPEGDLLQYKEYYHSASQLGFFEYLLRYEWFIIREPVFYIFTYFLNKVYFDSYKLYILTITFIIYYLTLKSLYKYWKYYDSRKYIIIFSILLFALFYINFSGSSHLIRQMLAGSIFLYYLTNKIVHKKNNYLLPLLAVLIHNSSIILFLLTLIPGIEKKYKLKTSFLTIGLLLLCVFMLQVIVSFYGNLIYSLPVLGPTISRVFEFQAFSDTREFVTEYSLIARYILPIVLIAISVLVYNSKIKFPQRNYSFINIFIIFFVIVEILHQIGLNFAAVRLNNYIYFFMPIIVPHYFSLFKSRNALRVTLPIQTILVVILLISLVWFLSFSSWTYAPIIEIIFNPVLFYFLP